MADEITLQISASLRNGSLVRQFRPLAARITQNAQQMDGGVAVVGTSEEDLTIVDVTTPGLLMLLNLDPANYVVIGPKSGGVLVDFGRLNPGEPYILRLEPGVVVRWIADTAPVSVQWELWSD